MAYYKLGFVLSTSEVAFFEMLLEAAVSKPSGLLASKEVAEDLSVRFEDSLGKAVQVDGVDAPQQIQIKQESVHAISEGRKTCIFSLGVENHTLGLADLVSELGDSIRVDVIGVQQMSYRELIAGRAYRTTASGSRRGLERYIHRRYLEAEFDVARFTVIDFQAVARAAYEGSDCK